MVGLNLSKKENLYKKIRSKYCIIAFGLVHCMIDNMKEEKIWYGGGTY